MKDGIYFVVFSSNQNDVGSGTVVVKDGAVNGGDFGFTYQGKVQDNRLDLHVFQHNPQAQNVIGGLKEYTINLLVNDAAGGYQLTGSVDGHPEARLSVTAKHIGNLI
ncbi:GrlR family regulatory protein [Yersinia kristensenii]|uniref:GrlR family regulatory protein n=1 Tax=Yersinia kristensenii TaxID=28152 RepID=UPI0011A4B1BD|nr:GrlR family regulatory protein [Yersinia kristensenii]